MARVIPQKELRNDVGRVLREAEAGERFTITVAGRPVAELGPVSKPQFVPTSALEELWRLPPDDTLLDEIAESFTDELRDPWSP